METAAGRVPEPSAMLISHSHRFAYIHIPKVAGVSISRTLGCRYGTPIDHYWGNRLLKAIGINVNHYAPYQLKKFRLHTPAWILKISQSAMLTDTDGRLLVDFVGRFETLDAAFAQVCRRIGTTVRLPRLNSTVHADYRSYYSDRLADEVGRYFAADAARFGYCFDGFASLPAAPGCPVPEPDRGQNRGPAAQRQARFGRSGSGDYDEGSAAA